MNKQVCILKLFFRIKNSISRIRRNLFIHKARLPPIYPEVGIHAELLANRD